jgi:hypothetical protein
MHILNLFYLFAMKWIINFKTKKWQLIMRGVFNLSTSLGSASFAGTGGILVDSSL